MKLPRRARQHAGDQVRAVVFAIGTNLVATAARDGAAPLFVMGAVLVVIGVVANFVVRIDIETAIDCALHLPPGSTRADLHEVMCGRPVLFDD